jgi:hypothetical protein
MEKLFIFLSFIVTSAQAMNYEVVGSVKRKESVAQVIGSSRQPKIITYEADVKEAQKNELLHAAVERKYISDSVYANPLTHVGNFSGKIADKILQAKEAIELFSEFSDADAEKNLIKIADLKQSHEALLKSNNALKLFSKLSDDDPDENLIDRPPFQHQSRQALHKSLEGKSNSSPR